MANNLPTDIITLILTRLPVKSLIRFKCISKHWNSLISNPHLISLHLTHSLSSNNHRLLILNYGNHLQTTPLKLTSDFVNSEDGGGGSTRFDMEGCFRGYEVSVIGCCNGLVALVFKKVDDDNGGGGGGDGGLEVVVWNPAIGCWLVVPRAPKDDDHSIKTEFMGVSFGFGFNEVDDDYKIIRVVDYFALSHSDSDDDGNGNGGDIDHNDDDNNIDNVNDYNANIEDVNGEDDDDDSEGGNHRCRFGFIFREVMVYILKENSWNRIHVTFFGDKMEWFCPGAVINNHIVHWLFWAYRNNKPILRGFDFWSLEWTILSLPDFKSIGANHKIAITFHVDEDEDFDYGYKPDDFVVLGVLDDCLCLVTRVCPEFDNVYVWVMKEYGVKESWTKLFDVVEVGIVGPLLGVPLACCNGGNEVLLRIENEDGKLCCYDLKGKTLKDAPKVPTCDLKLRDVRVCVESLVPVRKIIDGNEPNDQRLDEVNG